MDRKLFQTLGAAALAFSITSQALAEEERRCVESFPMLKYDLYQSEMRGPAPSDLFKHAASFLLSGGRTNREFQIGDAYLKAGRITDIKWHHCYLGIEIDNGCTDETMFDRAIWNSEEFGENTLPHNLPDSPSWYYYVDGGGSRSFMSYRSDTMYVRFFTYLWVEPDRIERALDVIKAECKGVQGF